MRIAFVQTSPGLGCTEQNLTEAYSLLEKVQEADLAVLPELFHSGYAVRDKGEAEFLSVIAGEKSEPLAMVLDTCRKFQMHIVAGFLEQDENKNLYNSAWLIGQDGILAKYRKNNLFNLEKSIFKPGMELSPVTTIGETIQARIGMMVCFDWIFPEPWGKIAWEEGPGTGAQIIAHPVNLVLPDACPLAIRTRAMENRVFIVTSGRVGVDPGPDGDIEFRAGSRIIAPDGTILAAGHESQPDCDMVEIDPTWADDKFVTPRNHILRERFGIPNDEDVS
jgi:predicted amidohydrolase